MVSVGPLHTGVFNVADVSLVAGLLLLGLAAAQPDPARHPIV
jgi:lipoprotein signal peptidase